MAYRRTANLPGTQQYGLRRRQQRSVEEYDWNPNLSRSERRLINPPLPAVPDLTHDLGPSADDPNAIDPSLAPDPPALSAPSPDPDATLESTPSTSSGRAGRGFLSEMGRDALKGGIIGTILGGFPTGTLMGAITEPLSPLQMIQNIIAFINQESLEAQQAEAAQAEGLDIEGQTEAEEGPTGPTATSVAEAQSIAQAMENEAQSLSLGPGEMGPSPTAAPSHGHGGDEGGTTGPGPSFGGGNPADISPGYGDTADMGDGDGDGGTVLCTALYDMGHLDKRIYKAGSVYAGKYVDSVTYAGYFVWARHLAKSKWAVMILSPFIRSFAKEMNFRLRGGKGNFVGKVIMDLGSPVCKLIGKITELGNVRNYI
jgi:hypothetical protein